MKTYSLMTSHFRIILGNEYHSESIRKTPTIGEQSINAYSSGSSSFKFRLVLSCYLILPRIFYELADSDLLHLFRNAIPSLSLELSWSWLSKGSLFDSDKSVEIFLRLTPEDVASPFSVLVDSGVWG